MKIYTDLNITKSRFIELIRASIPSSSQWICPIHPQANSEDSLGFFTVPSDSIHFMEDRYDLSKDPFVDFCLSKGIQLVWDYSFETIQPRYKQPFFSRNHDFIIDNNIKILTNFDKRFYHLYRKHGQSEQLMNQFVDVDLFPYHTRYIVENHIGDWSRSTYPVNHKDKKYKWCALIGDVAKTANCLIAGVFDQYEDGFVSKILNRVPEFPPGNLMHVDNQYIHKLTKYIDDNRNSVFNHKPFDHDDERNMKTERRLPQQLYDSWFNIVVETLWDPHFFTEKSYKGILAGVPFIHTQPHYNKVFAEKYGYQLYDEIFDYSFDDKPPQWYSSALNAKNILDQIPMWGKGLIFEHPSVIEKVRYNKNRFLQLTHTAAFVDQVDKVLGECYK